MKLEIRRADEGDHPDLPARYLKQNLLKEN
jgi:hypothetical protein